MKAISLPRLELCAAGTTTNKDDQRRQHTYDKGILLDGLNYNPFMDQILPQIDNIRGQPCWRNSRINEDERLETCRYKIKSSRHNLAPF